MQSAHLLCIDSAQVLLGQQSGSWQSACMPPSQSKLCCRSIPPAMAGVVFLSGGQTEAEATQNLQCIVQEAGTAPWRLTFSYGRALQV